MNGCRVLETIHHCHRTFSLHCQLIYCPWLRFRETEERWTSLSTACAVAVLHLLFLFIHVFSLFFLLQHLKWMISHMRAPCSLIKLEHSDCTTSSLRGEPASTFALSICFTLNQRFFFCLCDEYHTLSVIARRFQTQLTDSVGELAFILQSFRLSS